MIKIFTLAGALLLFSSSNFAQEPTSFSSDSSSAFVYDFGIVTKDNATSRIFKVYNPTQKTIRIKSIWSSPYCHVPVWSNKPIKPSKHGLVKVVYNGEQEGPFEAKIKVLYYNQDSLKGESCIEDILVKGFVKNSLANNTTL